MGHLEGEINEELDFTEGEIDEIAETIRSLREQGSKSKKPKSEKRQRGVVVSVRMTIEEFEIISTSASEASMSVGGFLRSCAIGAQTPSPWFHYRGFASMTSGSTSAPAITPTANVVGGQWVDEIEQFANSK